MAYINMKRILALILSIVMIMAMTCTVAFASQPTTGDGGSGTVTQQPTTGGSGTVTQQPTTGATGGDLFEKGEALLKGIHAKILGISTALAAVCLVIAACMWGFGNKQQSQAGWEWMKRILIAYVVINAANLIVATVGNLANI